MNHASFGGNPNVECVLWSGRVAACHKIESLKNKQIWGHDDKRYDSSKYSKNWTFWYIHFILNNGNTKSCLWPRSFFKCMYVVNMILHFLNKFECSSTKHTKLFEAPKSVFGSEPNNLHDCNRCDPSKHRKNRIC